MEIELSTRELLGIAEELRKLQSTTSSWAANARLSVLATSEDLERLGIELDPYISKKGWAELKHISVDTVSGYMRDTATRKGWTEGQNGEYIVVGRTTFVHRVRAMEWLIRKGQQVSGGTARISESPSGQKLKRYKKRRSPGATIAKVVSPARLRTGKESLHGKNSTSDRGKE